MTGGYPNESAGAYGQAAASAAAPAKKRGRLGLIILAVVAVVLIYSAISGKSRSGQGAADPTAATGADSITLPAMDDLIKLHQVYLDDEGDGVRIYAIVFYTSKSHTLTDLTVEFVCDKEYDYTLEGIRSVGLEVDYPGFAETYYDEDDDYVKFICKMHDLKDTDHLQAMIDSEILVIEDDGPVGEIDADYYMQSYLDDGWVLAPAEDYQLLDLSLD